MPRISIIVPNFNGRHHLGECLESVRRQDVAEAFEILVVDNASTDGSADFVRMNYPETKVVETGGNLGFGAACNRGAAASMGEYVVFLNNDVRVPADWLAPLVEAADAAQPTSFAFSSVALLYSEPEIINHAGTKFSPLGGGFDVAYGQRAALMEGVAPIRSGAPYGGAVLMRKATFLELGGFDEPYFLYFEDVDLGFRATARGLDCWVVPRSRIFHKLGASTGPRDSPIKTYWGQRNRVRMALKCFEARALALFFLGLPPYILVRLVELRQVGRDRPRLFLQGTWDAFQNWRTLRHLRDAFQGSRKRSDAEMRSLGLWAGFGALLRENRRLKGLGRGHA